MARWYLIIFLILAAGAGTTSCKRNVCPAYADYYAAKEKARKDKKKKKIRKLRKKRDKGLFPKDMSEKYKH